MDFLPKEISEYAELHSSKEPGYLTELERLTYSGMLQPRMLSGFLQGRFLAFLSSCLQPERVLEIGTYTGYSALCFAEGLQKNGRIISLEIDEERVAFARDFIAKTPYTKNIEVVLTDVKNWIADNTHQKPFDLIFLDGDKKDYPLILNSLVDMLSPRGIILADNVLWSGKVIDKRELEVDNDTKSIHRFTNLVLEDKRLISTLLPVRDGLLLIQKKSERA